MRSNHRGELRAYSSGADTHHTGRGGGAVALSKGQLISASWTADVEALESAIDRFRTDANLRNNCEVVCFEVAGDGHLHVNVIHQYATQAVKGWAGPGEMADGFVYNRRFADTSRTGMIRHVRDMIFAARG